MSEIKYHHLEAFHNTKTPEIIVPYIIDLIHPASILDVGCGIGTWLQVFVKNGVKDVLGIDGDYVDRDLLHKYISPDEFRAIDLEGPFDLGRKFDLAITLEVAEHLKESSADVFVKSICQHADTVLFSAAIPGQKGENHVNENWPSYWVEKFKNNGYLVYDPIRPLFWTNADIDPWYRQNMLMFSKLALDIPKPLILDIVNPDYWKYRNQRISILENQQGSIMTGKEGLDFYIKGLARSVLNKFKS